MKTVLWSDFDREYEIREDPTRPLGVSMWGIDPPTDDDTDLLEG